MSVYLSSGYVHLFCFVLDSVCVHVSPLVSVHVSVFLYMCLCFYTCVCVFVHVSLFSCCSQNQILLTVCMRYDNERRYMEKQELIWDLSQGASLAPLRRAVANLYHSPEQNLRLAKHVRDRYEWTILTDQAAPAAAADSQVSLGCVVLSVVV